MKLDQAFIATVRPVIMQVWNTIGYDSMQCAEECGERITNSGAIESCVDANRCAAYGGKEGKVVDKLLHKAFEEKGYTAVMRCLTRNIKLI